jgi:endonuclease/exonuclease/phosphatase family metal-dependent hydrolase
VPLAAARMVTLPTTRMSRRNARLIGEPRALIVSAGFAGRTLTLTAAHLHSRWSPQGRARQMAALLDHLEPQRDGPVILGGDLNTTSTTLDSRYAIARVPLQIALQPRRFRHPERHEPLFGGLERAGFEFREANVPGKPTFTFHRAIPPLLRPKLDWIALRGLKPVAGSARVVPARESFIHQRVSDHDFVMCEVRL